LLKTFSRIAINTHKNRFDHHCGRDENARFSQIQTK
jgi:hypothetical protein